MTSATEFWLLLLTLIGLALLCVRPLGAYMADVMEGKPNFMLRAGGALEARLYRLCGVDARREMAWAEYAVALLIFNLLGGVAVYALQRLQFWLPFNPQGMTAVSADSSFNTAVSFITNTNWQGYSGESTMGYLVQMAGLAVQNFLSAATGIAVAIALVRGFVRNTAATIGNFWVDVTRAALYVLLPLAAVLALALVGTGVIQNLDGYKAAATVETLTYQNPKTDAAGNPIKDAAGNPVTETATTQSQTLPMGPVASQEAIKELGTNGGGFYNANSAHPYENPTPFSNLLEMLAIIVIPFALTYTFGRMVGDTRQGWVLLAAMLVLLLPLATTAYFSEQRGNPLHFASGGRPGGHRRTRQGATWRVRKRASASRHRACLPP